MVEMKTFNYSRIYLRDELAGQRNRIFLILDELFLIISQRDSSSFSSNRLLNNSLFCHHSERKSRTGNVHIALKTRIIDKGRA